MGTMFMRTTVWTAAATLALGALACQDNAATPVSSTDTPKAQPSPVTNTNAVIQAPADPLASVANRDQLVADPNATKIDPPKPTYLVTGFSTLVRTGPRGAKYEAIETTANVREIQRDGDYFLITYPDAKGSGKTYAGWVYKDALAGEGSNLTVGAQPRAAGKLACKGSESHMRATTDFCAKTCKDDTGCDAAKGEICDGLAFEVNEKSDSVSDARYCISSGSASANPGHGPEHASSPALPVTK